MGKIIYNLAELVYKFIALNILWLLFFLLGLGVFGFMPSTVALFSVVREWIKGNKEIPIFRKYFTTFKEEFLRSNIIGLIFLVLFYVLYVNFSFVSYFYDESIQFFIYLAIIGIGSLIMMTFINVFSVMAHFQYRTLENIKAACGLVILHPLKALVQLIWVIAYVLIAIHFPKLFVGIGISVFAYILMSLHYTVFQKYKLIN